MNLFFGIFVLYLFSALDKGFSKSNCLALYTIKLKSFHLGQPQQQKAAYRLTRQWCEHIQGSSSLCSKRASWHVESTAERTVLSCLFSLSWLNHIISGDLSAAGSCCQSPVPPHPKGVSLDPHPVTLQVTEVHWTNCLRKTNNFPLN